MANIELNVVALGNFSQLNAQLAALNAQIKSTNAALLAAGESLSAKEISNLSKAFHSSMMASKLFTAQTVQLSTAAEHLGQRLAKGRGTWDDYRRALGKVTKETSLYNQLGQRQVAMQQAIVQNLGNGMARVYARHNVDLSNAATRSQVYTQALLAQNAALKQGATSVINWGKNMQWAGRQLTAGLTMPIALAAAGIAKLYNDVDKNLTKLAKVYGVGLDKPTQAQLASIRKDVIGLATELGKQLGISASEVTDTAAQFAAAGLQGKQLLDSTAQASRMVVLGEADKQEAINATISLQTAFRLNTDELTQSVNFFNAAQAATSTNMADLIGAIPRVGPVIRGLGGTYKDMVAILVAMKEGGVPAGEAANAIKSSLGRLINPTDAATKKLKTFGIDIKAIVQNNAGNLVGTLTDLQKQLDGLTSLQRQQAIAELFGKFQFARMTALMDNFGKTGTQSAKVLEMMGMSASDLAAIADEQTKKIQQSASGRFKIAVESFKNALIPVGEKALNMFSGLIETITRLIDKIEHLPGPIKTFLKVFGGLAVITGPVVMLTGLFGNLIGTFMKTGANLTTLMAAIFTKGVNPLKVLKQHFTLQTEEEVAAANAQEIFGTAMNKNVSAIEAVTAAIRQQIAVLESLIATQKEAGTAGIVNTTGRNPRGKYGSQFFGQQVSNPALTGENTTIARRATTFTALVPSAGVGARQGSLGSSLLIYENEARKQALMALAKEKGISDAKAKQLIWSKDQAIANEARVRAMQQISLKLEESKKNALQGIINEYNQQLALAKNSKARGKVNETYQQQLNTFFQEQVGFEKLITANKQELLALIKSGVTWEQVALNETRTQVGLSSQMLAAGLNNAMDDTVIAFRAASQNVTTGSVTYLESMSKGLGGFTRSHLVAATLIDRLALTEEQAIEATKILTAAEETLAAETTKAARVMAAGSRVSSTRAQRQAFAGMLPADVQQNTTRIFRVMNEKGKYLTVALDKNGKLLAYQLEGSKKLALSTTSLKNTQSVVDLALKEEAAVRKAASKARGQQISRILAEANLDGMSAREKRRYIAALQKRTLEELQNTSGKDMRRNPRMVLGSTAGGLGMGATMVGGMMMGSENKAVAAGGQSLMMGGMAAMMLPMMGVTAMLGPLIALAAAIPLLVAGFKYLDTEAKKAAAGLRTSMGVTKKELEALGTTVPEISSSLPDFNSKTEEATTAIERFKKAIDDASDTSEMKAFVDKLKEAGADQDKIDALVKQKATAMAVAGVKKEDVQAAIQAYLDSAGITKTNFDVGSLYDKSGKPLSSNASNALTGALAAVGLTPGQGAVQETKLTSAGRAGVQTITTEAGINIDALAQSLSAPFEALISTNTDLKDFLSTVQELNNQDFSSTTAGGQALNKTLDNLVADNPQLKSLMEKLKDKTPAEKMIYLRAAVEGVGGSIEDLPKMKTIDIEILLNKKSVSADIAAVDKSAIDRFNKSLPGGNTTGGGGSGGKSVEDKKIEKLQKQIELIKKQEEERKKALELQKKELDYEKSKLGLQNDLREALASGNLLKAAELRQQISQQEAQKNAEDANKTAEDSAQAKIDALQKQIEALQKKKSGSGGSGSKTGKKKGEITQADVDTAKTTAFNAVNNNFAGTFNQFLTLDAVKKYDKWLAEHKFTAEDIAKKNKELYQSLVPPDSVLQNTSTFTNKYHQLLQDIPKGLDPEDHAKAGKEAASKALQAAKDVFKNQQLSLDIKPQLKSTNFKINLKQNGDGTYTVEHDALGGLVGRKYGNGGIAMYAGAGPVSGPGGPKDDLIPAMLSNGEYVLSAASVAKYGIPMLDSINSMNFNGDFSVPAAAPTTSTSTSLANSQSVNAVFNIAGADAQQVADQAIKKLELMMKRNGSTVRI